MVDAGGSDAFWKQGYKWALRTSQMLAAFDVAWFEEPLKPDAMDDYVRLRQALAGAHRRRRGADAPAVVPALAARRAPSTWSSRT